MMVFLSLLPQGLWQAYASFTRDYAYARSAEVIHGPVMQGLVWARVPGDLVFAVGMLAFVAFVARAFLSRRHAPAASRTSTDGPPTNSSGMPVTPIPPGAR
jgi:nitric oxide reductase large subunit